MLFQSFLNCKFSCLNIYRDIQMSHFILGELWKFVLFEQHKNYLSCQIYVYIIVIVLNDLLDMWSVCSDRSHFILGSGSILFFLFSNVAEVCRFNFFLRGSFGFIYLLHCFSVFNFLDFCSYFIIFFLLPLGLIWSSYNRLFT